MEIAQVAIYSVACVLSFTYAIFTVRKFWRLSHLAQPYAIKSTFMQKVNNVIINVLLQKKLMKRPIRGLAHVFIFYGFIVYGAHTSSQIIGGFFGPYTMPLVGTTGYEFSIPELIEKVIPHFNFIYGYALDIFSILVLAGLLFFALRRWVYRAYELDRPSLQSMIVIGMISLLMLSTLVAEASHAILHANSHISPIRQTVVNILTAAGINQANAGSWFIGGWWTHIMTVFAFMAFVPNSKHAHLIWAPANFWFEKETPKGQLSFIDLEDGVTPWGSAKVQDFTWKDHLNGLSCIECGRCTIECPANRTGKVLNPKSIMTDLKHALMEQMSKYDAAKKAGKTDEEIAQMPELRVIDNYTSQEALWACTTCYACVEACPVGNNQVDAIVGMRRALVLSEGNLPGELQTALTNMENQSNPWGVGAHKREEWTEGLDIKTMAKWKEEGKEPEVLFWVGCAGAFDDRNKKIARSIATVLNKADVKYGILGTEENCTGDSARRAGNEYLFQTLAGMNIQTMNNYGVKKVVTGCPHCFNTLKNEYPQLGGNFEVEHHSTYFEKLVNDKKIELDPEKAKELGSITYHDSCYLGRYNDTYDAPRAVISKATGTKVVEPNDHKQRGLCCGAGGAQMWKEEEKGNERVNVKRTKQLVATEARTVASACPFCLTMITDGVKELGQEEGVKTLDIAEILERSLK
ncbi:MAG: putative iron-sulfur-binding oxidoreductase FadF [Turneriella sp.]|nr:putative iron-sulfur-binding oxidoreductase FadF [Turneriella sp.]